MGGVNQLPLVLTSEILGNRPLAQRGQPCAPLLHHGTSGLDSPNTLGSYQIGGHRYDQHPC